MAKKTENEKKLKDLLKEIFDKWGIKTESPEERKAKGSLVDRFNMAVKVIKKLKGWRDSYAIMPVLWLEAKADELREKADMDRAERAECKRAIAEKQQGEADRAKAA